ncbi:MAG: class I SAM-dependent methyltransferase, partial [Psychrosphaera sp.]|nr:class I SAM-dependent methyltransferase [Psychrosphaera sp.]
MKSAAEAGLLPQTVLCKRYPKVLPFSRITLNYFSRKDYTIRNVRADDLNTLFEMEACLPAAQQNTSAQIEQRINQYPDGQIVMEQGGKTIGVIYSQRDGEVVELLYMVIPSAAHKVYAEEFVDFMQYFCALKNGIDEVNGAQACRDFSRFTDNTLSVAAHIENYMASAKMSTTENTLDAERELEAMAARWLLRIFQQMGVMKGADLSYEISALQQKLQILPKYHKLMNSLFGVLRDKGFVTINGETITTVKDIEDLSDVDFDRQFAGFEQQFAQQHPSFIAFLSLVKICLTDYADILTGKTEATDVVFPEGSMALFGGIFKGNKVADHFNKLMAEVIGKEVIGKQASNTELCRVLEIGAGTGGASEVVLPHLAKIAFETGAKVQYFYTDISSSFTRHGKKRFGDDYPWIEFERLDIEKDPQAQGYELASFDIVFASNVLHDTKYIVDTMSTVNRLLKPGGLVVLNEFTKVKDLLLYTGALLHGYWLFEDYQNRIENSCLLSVKKWDAAFTRSGFGDFYGYGLPFEQDNESFRQSVMFATKTGVSTAIESLSM